jgi:hypothetical protein
MLRAAATTDPRVQRHDMLQIREPRVDPEPAGHRGQIDQPAVTAHVLGHRDQQPTGPQHRVTRRIHHSHRSAEGVAASVPEIRRVGVIAVAVGVALVIWSRRRSAAATASTTAVLPMTPED